MKPHILYPQTVQRVLLHYNTDLFDFSYSKCVFSCEKSACPVYYLFIHVARLEHTPTFAVFIINIMIHFGVIWGLSLTMQC